MVDTGVFIHAAAALGPAGDTTLAERHSWTTDPPPHDFRDLVKRVVGAPLRQASHLVELAAVGSRLCLSRLPTPASDATAVYVGTGLAEVRKTNALFFQVMTPGPGMASPFDFINAANNMAAFYTAKLAGLRARNLTITQEEFSFEWALKLAVNDLRNHGVAAALVGGFDENAHPRDFHMRRIALDDAQIMGEGSGWLYLSEVRATAIGEILSIDELSAEQVSGGLIEHRVATCRRGGEPVVLLPGFRMADNDVANLCDRLPTSTIYPYLPHCGCFHTASAFGIASAFDAPTRQTRLIVHVNRRPSGHWMLVVARQFGSLPPESLQLL